MIEAHIEQSFIHRGHKVWIFDRARLPGPHVLYHHGDDVWEWQNVEERADIAPTLELPEGALDALLKAASGFVHANDATVEALADTRVVRDRALALVEALVVPQKLDLPTPVGVKT